MKDQSNCKKNAVFSCCGIGDGLISLVLSHNLYKNGCEVTTFHPKLVGLQTWFPHLKISPFPEPAKLRENLAPYEHIYLFYEKTPWMEAVIQTCQDYYLAKTTILNPIATPNRDYPYWEQGRFDGKLTFVDNLYNFCKTILHLPQVTKENGITIPTSTMPRRFPKRVVLHPTSAKEEKNWPRTKFLQLAERLSREGFEPVFTVSLEEREQWPEAPLFPSLEDLARFVCESGGFIGNDSGIGHLASCLGIPTVSICRTERTARFWRPGWATGTILFPPAFVPNLKAFRLRDRYWKELISVRAVLQTFVNVTS